MIQDGPTNEYTNIYILCLYLQKKNRKIVKSL